MIFLLISFLVPVVVYTQVPNLLERATKRRPQYSGLLVLACFLFFISWYVPSPLIDGKNTAFTTHFVGGGIFSGALWLYVKNNLQWKPPLLMELVSLFAFTSTLGVANELFEFFAVQAGIAQLSLTDTSLDLVANTLGMLLFTIAYYPYRLLVRSK